MTFPLCLGIQEKMIFNSSDDDENDLLREVLRSSKSEWRKEYIHV